MATVHGVSKSRTLLRDFTSLLFPQTSLVSILTYLKFTTSFFDCETRVVLAFALPPDKFGHGFMSVLSLFFPFASKPKTPEGCSFILSFLEYYSIS